MPELPDIEGFRRTLARTLAGRRVERVQVLDPGVLNGVSPAVLGRLLHGRRFGVPDRHGKWLVLPTDGPSLVVHCGMTGRPYVAASAHPADRFDRFVITLDDGEFRYADQRKLRGLWLLPAGDDLARVSGALGVDALTIEPAQLRHILDRPTPLKAVLVDQTLISGLGNMLGDEICWHARINPLVAARAMDDSAVADLHRSMRLVLQDAVKHGCIPRSPAWLSSARGATDAPCPRCGTTLCHSRVRQRTTLWCPRCQPSGT